MSARKTARLRAHQIRHGFMVVHPRWNLTGVQETNVTPKRWVAWAERRSNG